MIDDLLNPCFLADEGPCQRRGLGHDGDLAVAAVFGNHLEIMDVPDEITNAGELQQEYCARPGVWMGRHEVVNDGKTVILPRLDGGVRWRLPATLRFLTQGVVFGVTISDRVACRVLHVRPFST